MLQIENLCFAYPRSRREVFSDLTMQLDEGRIYGLLGMNGAGKSTLLYLISSLLLPHKGRVLLDGKDVSRRRAECLQEIFIVPEEYDLPKISLEEYVRVNAPFYPRFSREALRRYVAAFSLPENVCLGELSMGQKKKMYMCFALATGVRLILMDEPTNGMDIPSKTQFRQIVREGLAGGSTILISTHQVKDVETLLDSVIVIDRSRILLNRTMDEVRRMMGLDAEATVDLEALFNKVMMGGMTDEQNS